jgi:hypothetical protein
MRSPQAHLKGRKQLVVIHPPLREVQIERRGGCRRGRVEHVVVQPTRRLPCLHYKSQMQNSHLCLLSHYDAFRSKQPGV